MQLLTSIFDSNDVPKVAPNGAAARVMLCFLTTAGFFYINIMPALVNGLVDGLGFSNTQAGLVSSANIYGTAVGALAIVFLIKKLQWKTAAAKLLLVLIVIDFLSMQLTSHPLLMAVRFIHGLASGTLVGIGFAIIARTYEPDRTFGVLLLVQFGLGGFGVMLLPPLVPQFGTAALFLSLIAFALLSLLMLPFLSRYPVEDQQSEQLSEDRHDHRKDKHHRKADQESGQGGARLKLLLATLSAIFLFQAANMGLYAFIIGLGKHYGLAAEFINPVLGAAAWVGIIGSLLVIVIATRYGRSLPLLAAILLTIAGTAALHFSDVELLFILANCGVGITWAFVMPYLFGMCAEFDKAGQMAALGGFASKMGLASGPLVASLVLADDNYVLLINIAVVGLGIALAAALVPAWKLDRKSQVEISEPIAGAAEAIK